MKKTILIVDDSENIRNLLIFTLENAGYNVLAAEDGFDAFKFLDNNQVDIILTDLYMPNINGIELIKKVRKKDSFKQIPILMLTTESQQDKKLMAKDVGANGWIIKPFAPEKLLAAIDKVLINCSMQNENCKK